MKKTIASICLLLLVFMLFSGCNVHEHDWLAATCTAPKTCSVCGETEGDALGHRWKGADCTHPLTCERCKKTEGSAEGHAWIKATCTEPKTCSKCGMTEGSAAGHRWSQPAITSPSTCNVCGEMKPLPLPENGQVFIGDGMRTGSELTIKTADASCYVKLKDKNGKDVYAFFVRKNTTRTVDVPTGQYYVYFACGADWYGTKEYFGEGTSFSKDREICDFSNYTYTYTLYKTTAGNFTETPVSESEFD